METDKEKTDTDQHVGLRKKKQIEVETRRPIMGMRKKERLKKKL